MNLLLFQTSFLLLVVIIVTIILLIFFLILLLYLFLLDFNLHIIMTWLNGFSWCLELLLLLLLLLFLLLFFLIVILIIVVTSTLHRSSSLIFFLVTALILFIFVELFLSLVLINNINCLSVFLQVCFWLLTAKIIFLLLDVLHLGGTVVETSHWHVDVWLVLGHWCVSVLHSFDNIGSIIFTKRSHWLINDARLVSSVAMVLGNDSTGFLSLEILIDTTCISVLVSNSCTKATLAKTTCL